MFSNTLSFPKVPALTQMPNFIHFHPTTAFPLHFQMYYV
jgi:hypothetical protein